LRIQLEAHPRAQAWLSTDECARAARFVRPVDRDEYTVAHAALRLILAARLGRAPQALVFARGAQGKPALHGLEFSLSHTRGLALVAVAAVPVGVDVERIEPLDALALARHRFSAAERAALERVPADRQQAAFYGAWVRKEAFVKATGAGLSRTFDQFDVSIGGPATLLATRPDAGEAGRWCLADVDAGADHAAALCVSGAERPDIAMTDFSF
jgi:4'-phosphopantetheinyl transferase